MNFNVLKTESKVNGTWQKYDVKTASPSKATAYIGWAPDPWSLRVQSTTSFDVSDAQGYKVDGYTTRICSAVISFRWVHSASALKTSSTVTTPLSGAACTTVLQPGLRPSVTVRLQRQGPNLWSELLCAVLTGIPLQQRYADINMAADSQVDII